MPLEGRHHVLDRHIISNRRKVIHKRLFQKPLWRPSRRDFLRSGAHVLKYVPLRCSKITPIRLTRTTFDGFRLTLSRVNRNLNYCPLPRRDNPSTLARSSAKEKGLAI